MNIDVQRLGKLGIVSALFLGGFALGGGFSILAEPATWKGQRVRVEGTVTDVCPKKGCWMMVKDGKESVRVKFTDYSFFVPLDCARQFATAEGTVTVRVETEAERRHYAEDAGATPEEIAKIKGDKTILSFMADAVQIGKPPATKKPKGGAPKKGKVGGKKSDG